MALAETIEKINTNIAELKKIKQGAESVLKDTVIDVVKNNRRVKRWQIITNGIACRDIYDIFDDSYNSTFFNNILNFLNMSDEDRKFVSENRLACAYELPENSLYERIIFLLDCFPCAFSIQGKDTINDLVASLENENLDLIIQSVNEVVGLIKPDEELDGTYWCAGSDIMWSKVKGVKRFLSYESFLSSYIDKLGLKEKVEEVVHDLNSEDFPFAEASQNIALVKTIGLFHGDESKACLWKKISYTLEDKGILVSDEEISENFSKFFKEINCREFERMETPEWIFGVNIVGAGYMPYKFKLYQKVR